MLFYLLSIVFLISITIAAALTLEGFDSFIFGFGLGFLNDLVLILSSFSISSNYYISMPSHHICFIHSNARFLISTTPYSAFSFPAVLFDDASYRNYAILIVYRMSLLLFQPLLLLYQASLVSSSITISIFHSVCIIPEFRSHSKHFLLLAGNNTILVENVLEFLSSCCG